MFHRSCSFGLESNSHKTDFCVSVVCRLSLSLSCITFSDVVNETRNTFQAISAKIYHRKRRTCFNNISFIKTNRMFVNESNDLFVIFVLRESKGSCWRRSNQTWNFITDSVISISHFLQHRIYCILILKDFTLGALLFTAI